MNRFKALLAFLGLAAGVAVAQVPPTQVQVQARPDIASLLGLDAWRAAQVNALLESAHEKARYALEQIGPPKDDATRATMRAALEAIRADTDTKLAAMLTPEQMARLHAALPAPSPRLEPMNFRKG